MVPPTGPTRLALFLLCCTGAWLAVHMAPTRDPLCQTILLELKDLSEQLLKVQEDEVGLPVSPYPLPPLSDCCQPHSINSSAILPYVRAIKPLVQDATVIEDATQQLVKLKARCELSTEVPVPTLPSNCFDQKRFISAVVQKLSSCLKSL